MIVVLVQCYNHFYGLLCFSKVVIIVVLLQYMDSAIDFVADLYDLSIGEVQRAMGGEEYWCI